MLRANTPRMDRVVFRICVAFQYSAAKELTDYNEGARLETCDSRDRISIVF
jgi:hypothetical protein